MSSRWTSLARGPVAALGLLLCAPAWAAGLPRVVLDPGHGGAKGGARAPDGFEEKDLSLQLARRVKAVLEARGSAEVSLTREGDEDVPLPERVARANARRPDAFVSLHANSMPTRKQRASISGIETFFLSAFATSESARAAAARENAESGGGAGGAQAAARPDTADATLAFILSDLRRTEAHHDAGRLAYALHGRVIQGTRASDRGVQQAPFFVLTGVEAPAVLVEVGFISHPDEGAKLRSAAYQERLARAIAEGLEAFLTEVARREARAAQTAP